MTNPDPELPNFRGYTPGYTRAGNAEFREAYYSWGQPPGSNHYTGYYYDSLGGNYVGWNIAHDFNAEHWPYYDYNPGIYWSGASNGLICMYAPYQDLEFIKYTYEQMRKEGRIVMANMGGASAEMPHGGPVPGHVGKRKRDSRHQRGRLGHDARLRRQ